MRFSVAGLVGVVIGLGLYELTYQLLPESGRRATVAWTVSYLVGVAVQHYFHRRFVFAVRMGFWASLWRTYAVYAVGSVIAVAANAGLVVSTSLHHRTVWLITTGLVSILNFFALKLSTYRSVSQ